MKKWLEIVCKAEKNTKTYYLHNVWSQSSFVVNSDLFILFFYSWPICCTSHYAYTHPLALFQGFILHFLSTAMMALILFDIIFSAINVK